MRRRTEALLFVRLTASTALAQMGLHLIAFVDTAIVGHLSVLDLAAAGIGRTLALVSLMVPFGWINALEALSARSVGAGDSARAWAVFVETARSILWVWVPCLLASVLVTFALPAAGIEPIVANKVRLYLLAQAPGGAAILLFYAAKALLQAHGQVLSALLAISVANVTNVVIGNLLVRGDGALQSIGLGGIGLPALGALGGGFAFTFSSLVLLAGIARSTLRCRRRGGPAAAPLRKELVTFGLPAGFQLLAEVGVISVVSLLAGTLGSSAVATHQIALSITTMTYMVALGVSGATTARVAWAVGRMIPVTRLGGLGLLVAGILLSASGIGIFAAREALVKVLTTDNGLVPLGMAILGIGGIFQLLDGIQCVAGGALRGLGDVRFLMIANVTALWLVGLPLGVLFGFAFNLGLRGLWLGLTLATGGLALVLCIRFFRLAARREGGPTGAGLRNGSEKGARVECSGISRIAARHSPRAEHRPSQSVQPTVPEVALAQKSRLET
jgi:MATE family multidrug resistance protein